jgi:hypothetical protein
MKILRHFETALTLATILTLTACAENKNPVALQPVQPDEETKAQVERMMGGEAPQTITLYQAIRAAGVPSKVAKVAFKKYDEFAPAVHNAGYIVMVDFTQHSHNRRFYLVNRQSGKVEQLSVAHGSGSDPDNDGIPQFFSNLPDSRMSSLGAYLVQEKYQSDKFGEALRLDGLEESNSNVRDRAIVLHPSAYVKDGRAKQGRSWGCTAVPFSWIKSLITRLQDGSFMYVYGVNTKKFAAETNLVKQWSLVPKSLWTNESEEAPVDGE